jgi:hypothetical protein
VPNAPALSGLVLGFQFGVSDPAATFGIAHTASVQVTLQ